MTYLLVIKNYQSRAPIRETVMFMSKKAGKNSRKNSDCISTMPYRLKCLTQKMKRVENCITHKSTGVY